MDAHLNNSQIDQLLRFASSREDGPRANQTQDKEARIHLKTCEICQSRVRTEKNAMGQLAQLKSGGMEARGSECPPDDVWLEVATGISRDAENYLGHAVQCDHCGPLLQHAVEDLADESTPQELDSLADLASSTRTWQRNFVGNLSNSETGKIRREAKRSPHRLAGLLSPSYLVLALLVTGLIFAGFVAYRTARNASTQAGTAALQVQQLQEGVRQQGTPTAQFTAELAKRNATSTTPPTRAGIDGNVTLLTLEPGMLRGASSETANLNLGRASLSIKLVLRFIELPAKNMNIALVDANQAILWRKTVALSETDLTQRRVAALVPKSVIVPGSYQVQAYEDGEKDPIETFSFFARR